MLLGKILIKLILNIPLLERDFNQLNRIFFLYQNNYSNICGVVRLAKGENFHILLPLYVPIYVLKYHDVHVSKTLVIVVASSVQLLPFPPVPVLYNMFLLCLKREDRCDGRRQYCRHILQIKSRLVMIQSLAKQYPCFLFSNLS